MSRESRQGSVTRSEMTRRTVHTARSSLGKLEQKQNSSERILESSSSGEIGHKTQANCDCEKCIQRFVMIKTDWLSRNTTVSRTREKAMLAEYNQKFSSLLTEKERLIRKLRAEKKALQEGKIFLKENITSRYEEVIQERETLVKEKMEQIGELHNDLSRGEARVRELEHSLAYQKSILESKDAELSKMRDLNIENNKLRREKAESDRKIKAMEEKLFKEMAKNKNTNDRRYEKHLEEIDKIVEKYCKNIDGSGGSGDISKKLSLLQESFISKHNYEAELRRRDRETAALKEKYESEEKSVADLTAEKGKLNCQIDSLRAELAGCLKKLTDAETRLSDEECVQRGEVRDWECWQIFLIFISGIISDRPANQDH